METYAGGLAPPVEIGKERLLARDFLAQLAFPGAVQGFTPDRLPGLPVDSYAAHNILKGAANSPPPKDNTCLPSYSTTPTEKRLPICR